MKRTTPDRTPRKAPVPAAGLRGPAASEAGARALAPLLGLQATCGNAAVSRLVTSSPAARGFLTAQRSFAPATVTKKTRLHDVVTVPGKKNRPDSAKNRGTVGTNIAPQTEVVVDQAAPRQIGKERWVRGVLVKPASWDPAVHKGAATSLRGTKLGPAATYPRQGSASFPGSPLGGVPLHWHEDLGEFMKVCDHPSADGRWLVRRARDGERARFTPGAPGVIDRGDPTIREQIAYGDIIKKAELPDGSWVIQKKGTSSYGKYDPVGNVATMNVVLTATEQRAVKEEAQAGAFRSRVALDDRLRPDQVTTTNIPYHLLAGDITVHVKGNTGDPLYAKQLQAVRDGLAKLELAGVPLADGLELYLTSKAIVQEAFHYGPGHVMLTPGMLSDPAVGQSEETSGVKGGIGAGGQIRGLAHQIADKAVTRDQEHKKGIIGCGVVVHEIGHVMHRKHDPDTFFLTQNIDFKVADLGVDVDEVKLASRGISHYVQREDNESKLVLEFVAEVFTGLVHGERYSQKVIDLYKRFGGYPTWTDERTVVIGGG